MAEQGLTAAQEETAYRELLACGWSDGAAAIVAVALSEGRLRSVRNRFLGGKGRRRWPDGRPTGAVWDRLRLVVFARDHRTCVYCGSTENLECDHVIPVSQGGGHTLDNLATACHRCNAAKRAKTPAQWRAARDG